MSSSYVSAGALLLQMMCTAPSRTECRPNPAVCQNVERMSARVNTHERGRTVSGCLRTRGVVPSQVVDRRAPLEVRRLTYCRKMCIGLTPTIASKDVRASFIGPTMLVALLGQVRARKAGTEAAITHHAFRTK